MKAKLKNFNLSIALIICFLISWIGQAIFQWNYEEDQAEAHGQEVSSAEYFNSFMSSTLENWQSEFLQLFSFVILSSFLIHKGSPQSKDGDEEIMEKLKNIEARLKKK